MKSIRNIVCPNVSSLNGKAAVAERGKDMAWKEWVAMLHPSLENEVVAESPIEEALRQILPSSTVFEHLKSLAESNPNSPLPPI